MISIRNLMVVLCLVLMGTNLFAGGFALSGVGSRATAMGGAYRGLSDDPSAMFWNPAGLGFMDENSVALGGTFILPSSTWDPTGRPISGIPGYSAKEYEAEKSLRTFPTILGLMAKNPKFKYGLGVYVPYGLGTTWDAYNIAANGQTYTTGFPEDEMMSSIAVLDMHPSVAYQINPKLSVGAGISAMYGTIEIAKIGFNSTLATAYGVPSPYIAPISTDLNGSGFGVGANLGIMYKPTPCLSVGLSGKIPSEVKMTGEAEVYLWKPLLGVNSPASKIGGKSDIDATLKLPAEVGLGLGYKVNQNWTVSLDYAYTMWDRLDKVIVEMDTPIVMIPGAYSISKSELIFNWENTSRISLGTEYKLGCNSIRAGVFMDQTPIPETTQQPTLSDVGTKYSGNLGWGRSFGNFGVDANVQYIMFDEREVTTTSYDAGSPTNLEGKYNSTSISGNIGLSYKF